MIYSTVHNSIPLMVSITQFSITKQHTSFKHKGGGNGGGTNDGGYIWVG